MQSPKADLWDEMLLLFQEPSIMTSAIVYHSFMKTHIPVKRVRLEMNAVLRPRCIKIHRYLFIRGILILSLLAILPATLTLRAPCVRVKGQGQYVYCGYVPSRTPHYDYVEDSAL